MRTCFCANVYRIRAIWARFCERLRHSAMMVWYSVRIVLTWKTRKCYGLPWARHFLCRFISRCCGAAPGCMDAMDHAGSDAKCVCDRQRRTRSACADNRGVSGLCDHSHGTTGGIPQRGCSCDGTDVGTISGAANIETGYGGKCGATVIIVETWTDNKAYNGFPCKKHTAF